jgi:hypothetical protein
MYGLRSAVVADVLDEPPVSWWSGGSWGGDVLLDDDDDDTRAMRKDEGVLAFLWAVRDAAFRRAMPGLPIMMILGRC